MTSDLFSKRTHWPEYPNPISQKEEELKRRQIHILDLTVSNPTQCGFSYFQNELLESFSNPKNLLYEPEPQGLLHVRETLCKKYYAPRGILVNPDDIFLTAGTSEAYSFIFKILMNPGDLLLTPEPSYPLLDYLISLHDVKRIGYPVKPDLGYQSLSQIPIPLLSQSKAILIVNPNNPTGHYVSASEATLIRQMASEHSKALIVDEVFWDYPVSSPNPDRISFAENTNALTFTFNGISKILGLPQMKLAWMVLSGPDKLKNEARHRLETVSDTFLSLSTPAQNAFGVWIENSKEIQTEIRTRIQKNAETLQKALAGYPSIKSLPVGGGWCAPLFLPTTQSDEEWALDFLEHLHLKVHPGYLYNYSEDAVIVVSLLGQPKLFEEGIRKIKDRIGHFH